MTNVAVFSDQAAPQANIPTNQFIYFLNVDIAQTTNYIDMFFWSPNTLNLWLENCTFRFTYDVFASSSTPLTNSVLVSHNCTYLCDAKNTAIITRTQYGAMARTCYVYGDVVLGTNGTLQNIGVDGSDTGKTNSTLYVWNTKSFVGGPGQKSMSAGSYANSQLFIGDGVTYDSARTAIQVSQILTNNSAPGYVPVVINGVPTWTNTFTGNGGGLTNVIARGTYSANTVNNSYALGQNVTNTGTTFSQYFISFSHNGNLANRSVDCFIKDGTVTNRLPWNTAGNVLTAPGTNFFNIRVAAGSWWALTNQTTTNIFGLTYDKLVE